MSDQDIKHDAGPEKEIQEEPIDEIVETDEEGNTLAPKDQLKKLREKLTLAVAEKQKYLDNWQRDKAEFVNARRRDEEAKVEYIKYAGEKIISDILPILDSFEAAISHANAVGASKEWTAGMDSVYNQLVGVFNKQKLVAFGQPGDVFDPYLHHSIATVPTTDKTNDGKIAEVLQKGYTLSGKVIRPALVKVFE